jgi:epoxyqueuosine reductase
MSLWEDLRSLAKREEIDFLGVADLTPAHDYILDTGGPAPASYPRCVSLGISLMDSIVDGLPDKDRDGRAEHYRMHAYDVVNARLDQSASKIAGLLQRRGHNAWPMSRMVRASGKPLTAVFSHKLGAHLAGLGWIGKSCMLITPERGPRVRWASVLTDAPLEHTGRAMEQRCGDCTQCVDICPVHAYTGRNFTEGEPREMRFDAAKCNDYLNSLEAAGRPRVCGLCLYACPYGRSGRGSIPVPAVELN